MRCPKCHYISFDSGERCRNCGYDFSLAPEAAANEAPLDLAIQSHDAPVGPLGDFDLADRGSARSPGVPRAGTLAAGAAAPITAGELPLFTDGPRAGSPAPVKPAPTPRPPLSVRKSNPLPRDARSRPDAEEGTLDLGAFPGEPDERARGRGRRSPDAHEVPDATEVTEDGAAGLAPRVIAGAIDTSIMVAVHGAVIYLTLRLCGLTFDEIAVVPPVPMLGFLLLLTGGYFVSFTAAGGQTIGKMATGIRVVPTADAGRHLPDFLRVPLGTAVLRAVACLLSVLPAGAGLLPALLSPDRRALHDRLADTRVVKA